MGESTTTEAIRRLQILRSEKTSLAKSPQATIDSLAQQISTLEGELDQFMKSRSATIDYCLKSEFINQDDKDRILEAVKLEDKELLFLNGMEIGSCLRELRIQLESLTSNPRYARLLTVLGSGETVESLTKQREEALIGSLQSLSLETEASSNSPEASPEIHLYALSQPTTSTTLAEDELKKVEDRVAKLEAMVGIDAFNRFSFPYEDLYSAVVHITDRLLTIDIRKMEALDEKAKVLVAELDKFATTKSKTDNNAFVDELKVDSLYTLAERWKTTAHSLPKIVSQMQTLALELRKSGDFTSRLEDLENEISALNITVCSSEKMMKGLVLTVESQLELLRKISNSAA